MTKAFRWVFGWHGLRAALIGLVGLITLVALAITIEDWRGKRAWESFRQQWEAKGERFDLAAFIAAPVPDDQNFARVSLFAPLWETERPPASGASPTNALVAPLKPDVYGGQYNDAPSFGNFETGVRTDLRAWQEYYRRHANFALPAQRQEAALDVLSALDKSAPLVAELRTASQRPHIVLPAPGHENIGALLAVLANVKSATVFLRLQATTLVEAGKPDEALQDIRLSFRLTEALKAQPLVICQLVRIATLHLSCSAAWEGLARHQWNETQLAALQQLLRSQDVLSEYGQVMRGERAFGNIFYEQLRRGRFVIPAGNGDSGVALPRRLMRMWPTGWFYQNQLTVNRLIQDQVLPLVDATARRVSPTRCEAQDHLAELRRLTPYNLLARLVMPALGKVAAKSARAQTVIDQATVGCALERFRLATGQYPAQLAALAPKFLERVPADVIDGQPLRYRRTEDGGYLLYSIGWDEKDNGGERRVLKQPQGGGGTDESGDWVWRVSGP